MKRINEWLIDSRGSIYGNVVNEEGEFVSPIKTTRVVKREGNVITTRSGSHYELLEASSVHMDRLMLDRYHDGAESPLAAIDLRIKLLDTSDTKE